MCTKWTILVIVIIGTIVVDSVDTDNDTEIGVKDTADVVGRMLEQGKGR